MLKDITLGQYYHTESLLHRMDPRVKLLGIVAIIIGIFAGNNLIGGLITGSFVMILIAMSRVPLRFMLKGMKAIVIFLIITVIFNLFLTPGTVIWSFMRFKITMEGVRLAIQMAFRLIFLILASGLLTLTTTPNNLTDGLESLLGGLKKFRVPVHEVAMMMSIALRFIPILMDETDKIMKAQMARGADFESGGILKRAKSMVPLLVPLFISAFRRANDLAMAMEARCYRGGVGRTKMKPLIYKKRDYISLCVLALYLTACILAGIYW
ncbi:MAG: energy-coupling factor transporter transmembrane protein EcfT [Lachnospiraceae bacterium]|nr:energy-coupling factor transporter transmembrane protein EcfT [Lachnospiraceae bacterium]